MWILRTFMLLALVVWIGGIIFFGFVVAPNLFSILEPEQAGDVVKRVLIILHLIGIICALVFLFCSLLHSRTKLARLKPFSLANVLVAVMLALTLISQLRIMPRMDTLRAAIHSVRNDDQATLAKQGIIKQQWLPPLQAEFDRLHGWSTRLEGGVLVLGIGVVVLTARRFQ